MSTRQMRSSTLAAANEHDRRWCVPMRAAAMFAENILWHRAALVVRWEVAPVEDSTRSPVELTPPSVVSEKYS